MTPDISLWQRYRLRIRRRQLLWHAFQARRQLTPRADRTGAIGPGGVLLISTMRNEARRIPHFLSHYRALGITHFLIVENDSTDETRALLEGEPDVSLWSTSASYREARFGMDWMGWLLARYGRGHWCLTVDADEILVYPDCETRPLPELTGWLDANGIETMSATMLELYPKGPLSKAEAAGDPIASLPWFDPYGYDWTWQPRHQNISIRGGPRRRMFFAGDPDRAPHLHKVPLVKWHWRYAYASSTHILLPRHLNNGLDARLNRPTGALMHTKFLPDIIEKTEEEKIRAQHFTHPDRYGDYHAALIEGPELWTGESLRYEGPGQLEGLGLLQRGGW